VVLVLAAMLIGSVVGQVTMTQSEYGAGESGRATRLLTEAGITEPAQELVLVHSATATAAASGFQSAVHAVVSGVEATGRVQDLRAPAVSAGRHDVLIQFAVKGDPDTFYLRREREERAAGRDRDAALRVAAATSGRSVLISGPRSPAGPPPPLSWSRPPTYGPRAPGRRSPR
jgi:putative drug exporter of the RND superfamily